MTTLDRRSIAGLLFVCALLGFAVDSDAQVGPGGAVTPAGGQPPLCTHAAGPNQLRTPASPTAPCGRLTDGYLARVTDGLSASGCATGGGTEVGLVQFDTSSNGWRCTSGGGGGISNPLSADLNANSNRVVNLGAPTVGTDAARNITLSGGAGITNTIGDLSANRSISVDTSEIGTTAFGSGTDFLWTLNGSASSGDPILGPVDTSIGISSTAGLGGGLRLFGASTTCLRLDGTSTSDGNYAQLCAVPDASGTVTVLMPVSVPGVTELLTTPLSANVSGASLYKMTGLAAGTANGDSVRFEQAIKTTDTCTGDLSGTFPACQVSNDSHTHGNSTISAGVDAVKIGTGAVSNTEFGYLDGASSSIQTQIDAKTSGPASTTDNTVARYDGTSGKIVQTSKCRLDDNGGLDCDPHPTDGGRIVLREGADDGSEAVTIAVPNTGLTASPTHTLTATGLLPPTSIAYTPTVPTDWPGASWLPTGTALSGLDYIAAKLKNWFGFYDLVVDVTGSATPCKTAQAALRNWHDNSYATWTGARNIWITGTASVTQTDLKDYGSYAVCLLAAGPSTSLDADGYPADGSIVFGTTRRLNLDLSGLQINVSRVAMSKPLIAVKIGLGHEAAWNYEWGGQLSASLWLSGSPELQCSGTPTLKESATGSPTTTNIPASAANRGYGWTATELVGKTITMTSGAASGQSRTITTNGTTDITVGTAFSVAPSAGDTFTVSAYWLASRVPAQPSTGEIFGGSGWPQQSCIALVEHNYKRSGAVAFNPQLRSSHGGTSSNGAGSVGWVAVNSWIVDRGDYRSFGFAIGGMVYGNMISTLKSFTAEGMGYGLIFGDPGIDGSVPDSNYVEVPRGLKIGGGQLEGAYYSEIVMYYGADITLRGMHIESEDANDRGLTAHVLIGAGTGAAADGYRPCWRDQDLPSGGSCTSAITATQSWIGVNIENSTLPTDRGRKAYRLSGWSAGKSSFISACAAASGTGGADMTVSGRGMKADVQQYDGWYGTDTVQVRLDGTGSYVDPWRIGDTVSCGGQTATIAAYAGHSAGLAFGPGAYIANYSNQASSRIGFDGSTIPNLSMADYEFRTQRAASSSAPTIISMYVPFVAHSTANARIDMSTAATAGSRTLYPPIGYPRRLVKLGGGLDRETRYMPAGTCIDTVFTPGAWNARSNTAGTYRGATTGCYAGTSYTQSGILRFDAATDNYVTRLDTIDAKSIVYASGTSERFAKDFTLLWRSASTNTGDVRWCYAVNCFAPASESPDLSFGTAVCTTATVPATSGNVAQTALALGISSTNNCAVGEVMQIAIYRDADDAADTMTGTADLLGVIEERDTYLW